MCVKQCWNVRFELHDARHVVQCMSFPHIEKRELERGNKQMMGEMFGVQSTEVIFKEVVGVQSKLIAPIQRPKLGSTST